MVPEVVIFPISWGEPISANHRFPSGPGAIPCGRECPMGRSYSLTVPDVVIRPIRSGAGLSVSSVNHSFPSGPAVIATGLLSEGTENSVTVPEVVIRPMWPPSVNHRFPSGPVVM